MLDPKKYPSPAEAWDYVNGLKQTPTWAKKIANKYITEDGGPPKGQAAESHSVTEQPVAEHPDSERYTEEAIAELAGLSEIAYQKERTVKAKELGISVIALDKLVRQARAQTEDDANALPHWSVHPSEEPVERAALLEAIRA